MFRVFGLPLSVARIETASPASNTTECVVSSQLVAELPDIEQVMVVLLGPVAPAGSLRTVNV